MTQQEKDELVGQVYRESRAADETLRLLLIKAEGIREQFGKLIVEIDNRVKRARGEDTRRPVIEGAPGMSAHPEWERAARGMDLDSYAGVLDLDALRALDEEIGEAAVRAAKLRERKRELGL